MTVTTTTDDLATRAADDGELRLAVRHWTWGIRLTIGDDVTSFTVTGGEITAGVPEPGPDVIAVSGPAEVWAPMLQAVPPRFANAIAVMLSMEAYEHGERERQILRVLATGEREIAKGKGRDLAAVLAEADHLFRDAQA